MSNFNPKRVEEIKNYLTLAMDLMAKEAESYHREKMTKKLAVRAEGKIREAFQAVREYEVE